MTRVKRLEFRIEFYIKLQISFDVFLFKYVLFINISYIDFKHETNFCILRKKYVLLKFKKNYKRKYKEILYFIVT